MNSLRPALLMSVEKRLCKIKSLTKCQRLYCTVPVKIKDLTEQPTIKFMLVNCDLTIIHPFFLQSQEKGIEWLHDLTTSVCQSFLMTMLSEHYVHLSSDEYASTWPLSFQNHFLFPQSNFVSSGLIH